MDNYNKKYISNVKYFILGAISLCLISCHYEPIKDHAAYSKIKKTLAHSIYTDSQLKTKKAVNNKVIDSLNPEAYNKLNSAFAEYKDKKFNISATNVPASEFFLGLTQNTPYNIVVSPRIQGNISLSLKDVTLEEVLHSVESVYGYISKRTITGYEIMPNDIIETEVFNVDYLNATRTGSSNTEITSGEIVDTGSSASGTANTATASRGGSSSGSSVVTQYSIDFWSKLEESLKSMLGNKEGRSVIVNQLAGTVMVRAYPKELKDIAHYLEIVQKRMNRQVIIEAKIMEIQLSDEYKAGVNWEILRGDLAGTIAKEALNVSAEALNSFGNILKFENTDFRTIIDAISTQGNINVLSSPRISTMNNQKAVLKAGNNEFFVTNVSTNTLAGSIGDNVVQDIELTPFFEGISIDVIPQVNDRNEITLHLRPSISSIEEERKEIELQDQTSVLPLAKSTIRETDNIVLAKNKQVIVIGGLIQNRTEETINRVPFLGRLPFIGTAFRNTDQINSVIELIILLKPTIVTNETTLEDINRSYRRFRENSRGFHFGEYPEIFGNEAETKPWKKGWEQYQDQLAESRAAYDAEHSRARYAKNLDDSSTRYRK